VKDKSALRKHLRALRRDHLSALPENMRALMFSRPPSPVVSQLGQQTTIGLYSAVSAEAPTLAYARWFHENGHTLALPWFANRSAAMTFRSWADPYDNENLESGPFGHAQPDDQSAAVVPDTVIVPLIGFTAGCDRIGQGMGHYDRWLEANPETKAIGLAWDCQLVDSLPLEPHDRKLHMIVTPTRAYERTD